MANVAILRNVGGLVFDATLREAHTLEIEVSDNPIESGSDVSDNMYVKPKLLTISAAVSDTPLFSRPNDPFAGTSRSQVAFHLLQSLQESGEPFNVQTGLKLYTNMMCLVLRAEQDKDTDRVLFFEAVLKEVLIVSTQTVTFPPRAAGKTTRQASQTTQKGKQQGTQVTKPEQQKTIADKLFHFIKDF